MLFHEIELELFDFPPDAVGQDGVGDRNPAEKRREQQANGHKDGLMINELHVRQGSGNGLANDKKRHAKSADNLEKTRRQMARRLLTQMTGGVDVADVMQSISPDLQHGDAIGVGTNAAEHMPSGEDPKATLVQRPITRQRALEPMAADDTQRHEDVGDGEEDDFHASAVQTPRIPSNEGDEGGVEGQREAGHTEDGGTDRVEVDHEHPLKRGAYRHIVLHGRAKRQWPARVRWRFIAGGEIGGANGRMEGGRRGISWSDRRCHHDVPRGRVEKSHPGRVMT